MGFIWKLHLSTFQRTPLCFSMTFEASAMISRMQRGSFQADCKIFKKKIMLWEAKQRILIFTYNDTLGHRL